MINDNNVRSLFKFLLNHFSNISTKFTHLIFVNSPIIYKPSNLDHKNKDITIEDDNFHEKPISHYFHVWSIAVVLN